MRLTVSKKEQERIDTLQPYDMDGKRNRDFQRVYGNKPYTHQAGSETGETVDEEMREIEERNEYETAKELGADPKQFIKKRSKEYYEQKTRAIKERLGR